MSTLTDFDRQTLTIEQQKALIDLEHSQQVAQMYVADAVSYTHLTLPTNREV